MSASPVRRLLVVGLTGCLVALAPLTAGAAGPSSSSAPVTRFITMTPWTAKGTLQVKATVKRANAKSSCIPSATTERRDAYRCFIGNGIYDPAFKSPTRNSVAFRSDSGRWTAWTKIGSFETPTKGPSRIVTVSLTNGAVCTASTGAGPDPIPGYPYWVGTCSGGPYGTFGGTWRATKDDGANRNYPLLALNGKRTKWAVPVEDSSGKVTMVPVRRAYR